MTEQLTHTHTHTHTHTLYTITTGMPSFLQTPLNSITVIFNVSKNKFNTNVIIYLNRFHFTMKSLIVLLS